MRLCQLSNGCHKSLCKLENVQASAYYFNSTRPYPKDLSHEIDV